MDFLEKANLHIYVINLRDQEDRRRSTLGLLEKLQIPRSRVTFYLTERDSNGERGCFNSHRACILHGISLGQTVMVMEDDLVLRKDAQIQHFLRSIEFVAEDPRDDWEQISYDYEFPFSTGFLPELFSEKYEILRMKNLTGGCYLLNPRRHTYIQKVLENTYQGVAIDIVFQVMFRQLAPLTFTFVQATQRFGSNIDEVHQSYMRAWYQENVVPKFLQYSRRVAYRNYERAKPQVYQGAIIRPKRNHLLRTFFLPISVLAALYGGLLSVLISKKQNI